MGANPFSVRAESPDTADAVSIEYPVDGYHNQVARQGLSDEHPVERVAMQARKPSGAFCVLNGDVQLFETLAGDCAGNVESHRFRLSQFADAVFGSDFPSGCSADDHVVRIVLNRTAGDE